MGSMLKLPTGAGEIDAYLATPSGNVKAGVIVIHEVWGLADHIKNVADRLSAEGYLALAPELLADTIDTKAAALLQEDLFNPEKRNAVQPKLRALTAPIMDPQFAKDTLQRVQTCFNYLYDQPQTNQHVAIIGFCFGGSYSFSLAVHEPRLALALPFYGHADFSVDQLSGINCPVRAFYGERDENLMQSLPKLKRQMADAKVDFEAKVYPDCGHAFFNDTNRYAYNQPAAKDAWQTVLADLASATAPRA